MNWPSMARLLCHVANVERAISVGVAQMLGNSCLETILLNELDVVLPLRLVRTEELECFCLAWVYGADLKPVLFDRSIDSFGSHGL